LGNVPAWAAHKRKTRQLAGLSADWFSGCAVLISPPTTPLTAGHEVTPATVNMNTKICDKMATIKEIDDFFNSLTDEFLQKKVPNIIAEKATAYFQQRFTTKEWDGEPWPETKRPVKRGTLMVRSGALVNSIKPKIVSTDKVVISGGSDKVNYAKAHNEGETIEVPVTSKMRKFAWAMHYKEAGDDKTANTPWKGLAMTKKTSLIINLPKRRFMGTSEILNQVLFESLRDAFNAL
jgi:phage gpG-like protein